MGGPHGDLLAILSRAGLSMGGVRLGSYVRSYGVYWSSVGQLHDWRVFGNSCGSRADERKAASRH